MKVHFVVEVDSDTQKARIVRINEEDFEILDAQISLGATPALKWGVRSSWRTISDAMFDLHKWIWDWINRMLDEKEKENS